MTCLASGLAYTASLFSHRGGLLFPPRPPHASNPVVHRPIAFQTTGRYELNRGGTVWSGASSAQRPAAPSAGRGLCCGLLPFLLVPGRQERGGGTTLSAPRDSAAPVARRPVTQARRCVRLHPYFESPIRPCETPRPSLTWVPVLMPAPFGCPCEIAAFTHAALFHVEHSRKMNKRERETAGKGR